jgi:hypothetical protein
MPANPPATRPLPTVARSKRGIWSIAFLVVIIFGLGVRAYRDLSRPEAWAYCKDRYFSPSMKSSLFVDANLDGSGHRRRVLAVSGEIGPAAAGWFRDRLDQAHLAVGDAIVLSSPGGDLDQALIIGEIIRSRGLVTAVGVIDSSRHIRPSYCASACVLAYAGGKTRFGVEGSKLGVHRFVALVPGRDPVAETQQATGIVLNYVTRMGVSSSIVEAMTATRDVRWLDAHEAAAMNLVTEPVPNL